MGEIAFLLGFEEVNSFMRAFTAWEGLRPGQWRARQRDRQSASPKKRRSTGSTAVNRRRHRTRGAD
jgi:AraC-like DNA-binding protein